MTNQLVGTLSVVGATGQETFSIPVNPGNIFSFSGTQLLAEYPLPSGVYLLTIQARGSGSTITLQEVLTWAGGPPPPIPPLMAGLTVSPISVGISQTATVDIVWNDVVINFTLPAFAVTNGTISNLTEVDGTHYTAIFTPTLNFDGSGTIQVQQSGTGGAVYTNSAGSATVASNTVSVAIDTLIPPPPPLTSAVTVSPTSVGVGQTSTVSISWNAVVIDFTLPAFAVTNGTLSALTEVDGQHYTALFTPTADFSGTGTVQVQQSGTGGAVYSDAAMSPTTASNTASIAINTVPVVGTFDVGVALSGLEDDGGTPGNPEMAYFYSKNIKKLRIPLDWPTLQPLAYGALNQNYFAQVSSVLASAAASGSKIILDMHNYGAGPSINGFYQSSSIGQGPTGGGGGWSTSDNTAAAPTITLNAATDSNGGTTASELVFPAVTSGWSEVTQNMQLGVGEYCFSLGLRGNVGGEVIYIMFVDSNFVWRSVKCTLTTSWQQFHVAGTTTIAGTVYFQIGTDLRDTNQSPTAACTIFAEFAQAQAGSTPTTYAPNITSVANYKLGTANLPTSAFPNLWTTFSTALRADPNFDVIVGYDIMNEWNTMEPSSMLPSTPYSQALILSCNTQAMTALRAAGDNTRLYLEWDHYSGAWDAVTNNISQLMTLALSDPASNSCVDVHCYLDQDSSGTHYVASEVFGQPSTAPPGINVTVNIGPERMAAVTTLAQSMGCPLVLGETGWSNDNLIFGGADNYTEWNQAGLNMLTFCQTNDIEVLYFAGGPGFAPDYPYIPSPSSTAGYFVNKDFTSAGLQASQMVIFDEFSGFSGAQPLAYASYLPFGVFPYSPSGTPLTGLSLQYNANISSTITFTGTAKLSDGTNVGGTFSTIQIGPGLNGTTTFSYTPAGTYLAIELTFTNNAGLTNPPAIGVSSTASFFNTVGAIASNVYSTRLWNYTYVGSSLTLSRPQDNAQMTFGYDVNGNLPRQAMQDWGNTRVFGVVEWFDQSGNGNNMTFNPATIELLMVDTDGYPSVYIPSAVTDPTGNPVNFNTPSIGNGQISVYSEMNGNGNLIVSQDQPVDNFRLTYANWDVGPNTGARYFAAVGGAASTWQTIAGTYSNLYSTDNVKAYLNGSMNAQSTAPEFVNAANNDSCTFGTFQFSPLPYEGRLRTVIIQYVEYNGTNVAAANTSYTTYTGTPLPDSLSAVAPTIAGGAIPVGQYPGGGSIFGGVTIFDYNSGSPTDSVELTVSGSLSTLSGSGITGTNPYFIAAASAASVTATLQALTFTSTASVGTTIDITIAVTSSAGTSASTTLPVTLSAYGIETAFTPPSGTFTPINHKGYMLGGLDVSGVGTALAPLPWQISYLASKGFGMVKIGTTQSSAVQGPTPFQPLNVSYVDAIKTIADQCFSLNLYLLIAFYDGGSSLVGTNSYASVGVNSIATNSCADERSRFASRFKNYPNVMFEMMNEPKVQTAAQWAAGQQVSVNAIRAAGCTTKLWLVGAGDFQHASSWTSTGNAAIYAGYNSDPGNNFGFAFHQYLDSDGSGTHAACVTGLGATVLNQATTGLATSWLASNGFQGIITEFGITWDPWFPNPGNNLAYDSGVSPETTGSLTENGNMLAYAKTNSSQWLGWTAFCGGLEFGTPPSNGGYGFNPEPQRNGTTGYVIPVTDQPQMAVLVANI